MSLNLKAPLINAVLAVQAVEKAKKRVPPSRPGVTYFSENDVWLFNARSDTKVCMLCRIAEEIEHFRGNELRMNFPFLVILDENTIGGPEPDGGGLVHPNCRCYLSRLIGKIIEV